MRTLTYSEEDLEELGYENTYMTIGTNQVWQTQTERILYDPDTMMIIQKYVREGRQLYGTGHIGNLGVGRRV
jgi:hypothetical protein